MTRSPARDDPEAPRRSRLPSLDGWRALSILLVLGSHARYVQGFPARWDGAAQWLFDGGLGVRTFFLISGLLITWLMLAERDRTGRLSLRRFYARRALRILPVYLTFLGVLALLQALTPFHLPADTWAANLTFTSNFLFHRVWTTAHLWSLAVEEQFYLLWPVLFVLLGDGRRPRPLLLIFAGAMGLAPVARALTYLGAQPPGLGRLLSEFSFFNNFDALALGCAAAFALSRWPARTDAVLAARPRATAAAALALVLVPYGLAHGLKAGAFTVPFAYTCEDLGVMVLILQSVRRPGFGPYPALNWAPVGRLGVLSYSIYLWQQLFSTPAADFGQAHVWWLAFPGWLVPCAVVAWASYYGLERPFLRLRGRFRN
jgi:peptidoglycan/LPS O-acetylase OafA/YrhL